MTFDFLSADVWRGTQRAWGWPDEFVKAIIAPAEVGGKLAKSLPAIQNRTVF